MVPKGRRKNKRLTIQVLIPIAKTMEQAKNNLARGVHQLTIYGREKSVSAPKIQMIRPMDWALEQVKRNLEWGSHQTDIPDQILEKNAMRNTLTMERNTKRAKVMEIQIIDDFRLLTP